MNVSAKLLYAFALLLIMAQPVAAQNDPVKRQIKSIIDATSSSVVQIQTIGGVADAGEAPIAGPFSGTLIDNKGHILTASFNLKHQPASIFVLLAGDTDGSQRFVAEVISTDHSRNLTLLKIDSADSKLSPIAFSEKSPQQGQRCVALGKFFSPDDANVSVGILSARGRIWDRAVQTDCKISRQNYGGPLVDLWGRAIGILVPASPNDRDVSAGAGWYDSGIGFAMVIQPDSDSFRRLVSGKDLRQGLLGINFEGSNPNSDAAKVSFCLPTSPAGKAGVREGDTIVGANDKSISRLGELKHVIGPLYENETVSLKIDRDGQSVAVEVILAGEIDPFVPGELGFGIREDDEKVRVTFSIENSKDILQRGDQIVEFAGEEIAGIESIYRAAARLTPDKKVQIKFKRDDEEFEKEIQTTAVQVIPPQAVLESPDVEFKQVDVPSANMPKSYLAIAADKSDSSEAASLLVWIPSPGPISKQKLEKRFLPLCQKYNCGVLVPQSTDDKSWTPDDANTIAKTIGILAEHYSLDERQIAVAGSDAGGEMALRTAFVNRKIFQGVAIIEGELSSRLPNFESTPATPMQVLAMGSEVGGDDEAALAAFRKAGFPIATMAKPAKPWDLIFRWISYLDRL